MSKENVAYIIVHAERVYAGYCTEPHLDVQLRRANGEQKICCGWNVTMVFKEVGSCPDPLSPWPIWCFFRTLGSSCDVF